MNSVKERQKKNRKKSLLDFLSSIPLAIILLIVIGLLAFTGTLIPQADIFSADELAAYNEAHPAISLLNRVVSSFQIADRDPWRSSIYGIYHSWWFVIAILLLALNLTVCSVRRLALLKHYFKRFDGTVSSGAGGSSGAGFSGRYELGKDELVKLVRKWNLKGFHSREEKETPEGTAFRFQRGRIGRLGYLVVHLGILMVIIGAMLSSLTREKGFVWLREGEETDRYYSRTADAELPLGFSIKAGRLRRVMYGDGKSVKDWYSDLVVSRNGSEILRKTIQVNDPLRFEGRSFYQASWNYGYSFTLKVVDKKTVEISDFPLSVGNNLINIEGVEKTYSFKDGRVFFRLQAFYPDFIITEEGFATRSQELNNPAAVLLVYWEGLKEAQRKVVFSKLPEMDFDRMHQKTGAIEEPFKFVLDRKITTLDVTGMEISSDRGTDVVYIGFYLVIAGMFLTFYFNHSRVWVLISPARGYCDVRFSGSAHRNKQMFDKELAKLFIGFEKQIEEITGHKNPGWVKKKNIKGKNKQ
jgi:cytochrome c biogenesis protein